MAKRFIKLTNGGDGLELINIDQIARVCSSNNDEDGPVEILLKGRLEPVVYQELASKVMAELEG